MTDQDIARPVPGRSRGWPIRRSLVGPLAVVVVVLLVAMASLTGWYRVRFHAWPWPSSMPDRVSYCERGYTGPGQPRALAATEAQESLPIRRVGYHGLRPLGQEMYANPLPARTRWHHGSSSSLPCAMTMTVYLRDSDDRYVPYLLSGGP